MQWECELKLVFQLVSCTLIKNGFLAVLLCWLWYRGAGPCVFHGLNTYESPEHERYDWEPKEWENWEPKQWQDCQRWCVNQEECKSWVFTNNNGLAKCNFYEEYPTGQVANSGDGVEGLSCSRQHCSRCGGFRCSCLIDSAKIYGLFNTTLKLSCKKQLCIRCLKVWTNTAAQYTWALHSYFDLS